MYHETRAVSDRDLLSLLDRDPQEGMVRLVEQYTGLLWSVAQQYLQSPEDIKECVNDAFAEFYFHRDRFDPERGTLRAFLAVIARHLAISRFRKDGGREALELLEDAAVSDSPSDPYRQVENQADLEKALASLKPLDVEIIRMKYYSGMTIPEIAEALGLPFTAVKKRHQRSLKKLRKLLLGLLLALILAALTACAYVVLRYFGVIPGYALTGSPEEQVYILEETDQTAEDLGAFQILDGFFQNGKVHILMDYTPPRDHEFLYKENGVIADKFRSLPGVLNGRETEVLVDWSDYRYFAPPDEKPEKDTLFRLEVWANAGEESLEALGETVEFRFTLMGREFAFQLRRARAEALSEHSFQIKEQGGLLAIPRLEEGRLLVGIYPLNTGKATLRTTLTRGASMEGEDGVVTVVGPDGRERTGECLYHASVNHGLYFYDWDFGPAEPGRYTLHVPYVYLTLPAEGPFSFHLDLAHDMWEPWEIEVPGGTLALEDCSRMEGPSPYFADTVLPDGTRASVWKLRLRYTPDGGDLVLSDFWFRWPEDMAVLKVLEEHIDADGYRAIQAEPGFQTSGNGIDPETGLIEMIIRGWEDCFDPADVTLSLDEEQISLRWEQSFDIPFTVEE